MKTDWIFQEPIDFEHKQYVLLNYLQKINNQLLKSKLYPNFQELSLHLANLNLIYEKKQFLTLSREIKSPDDEILISDLVANHLPSFSNDETDEIHKVSEFASQKIKELFNHAKALWDIANDSISIEPIRNEKNIEPKQGLIFIKNNDNVTYLYEFQIRPIKKGVIETKCHVKKICVCEVNEFENKLTEIKSSLIKNISSPEIFKNLIVFKVRHSNVLPFKETLFPISKRKVMNYMIQSKLIKNKNLTKNN